jgi:hypothetical protein
LARQVKSVQLEPISSAEEERAQVHSARRDVHTRAAWHAHGSLSCTDHRTVTGWPTQGTHGNAYEATEMHPADPPSAGGSRQGRAARRAGAGRRRHEEEEALGQGRICGGDEGKIAWAVTDPRGSPSLLDQCRATRMAGGRARCPNAKSRVFIGVHAACVWNDVCLRRNTRTDAGGPVHAFDWLDVRARS